MKKYFCRIIMSVTLLTTAQFASAGAIFLTGHDPDFHASDNVGAQHINQVAIAFIMDTTFNLAVAGGATKFLFVESNISIPGGHRIGKNGIIASGFAEGTDFDQVNASGLNAALDGLGSIYGGLVIASDFGGLLTQAELDILNSRSADIIDFLNINNGGLFAMAEGDGGSGLTPFGGHFGFLPFVTSSTPADQSEAGTTVTAFGASLGLTNADVSANFSHNIFNGTFGLNIVDTDSQGRILSLAGRGIVDPGTGVGVPEPSTLALLVLGLAGLGLGRRRKEHTWLNRQQE